MDNDSEAPDVYLGPDTDTRRWRLSPEAVDRHGIRLADLVSGTTQLLGVLHASDGVVSEVTVADDLHRRLGFTARYTLHPHLGRARARLLIGEREHGGALSGVMVDLTRMLSAAATDAVHAGLEGRAAIEQAKGALMITQGIDDEAAFALLANTSQHTNVKVRTVAEHVVTRMVDPELGQRSAEETLHTIVNELLQRASRQQAPDSA